MRSQGETAGNGGSYVKIGPVEEHPRVAHAILGHLCIFRCLSAYLRSQEPVDIVVVARDALPTSLQFATMVPPAAQAMQDNNLVPKSTARVNGGHIADRQI